MSKTALVLGAGLGGIVVAETLRKLLPRTDRVVVVEREAQHVFPPSLLWLMVGERDAKSISRPVVRIARRGIEVVRGQVTHIAAEQCSVEVEGATLTGDAMIIALGAEYGTQAIPGLSESGLCIYTLEGASAIHTALNGFSGGRLVILTAGPLYKCPAAPYEAALLVDAFLRKHGLREKTQIDFYAAEAGPMLVAGPQMTKAVRGMVEAQGVGYFPEHQICAVDPQARKLSFANGAEAEFDLLLYVPPHRAPLVVKEAGLTNDSGWIPVDRHTLETKFENVFAVGDVTTIPLQMGRPLPKAGVFAHGEAEVVAHNIAHAWTGRGESQRFNGEGACFIETGGGRAGMGSGNFYAEPLPRINIRQPGLLWHGAKVLYEKYWLMSRF